MYKKKKILYIFSEEWTFVKTDYQILVSQYHVTKYPFKPVKGIVNHILQLTKQLFFLVFNIWKYDVIYIWFADFHSLFPVLLSRLFSKKSFVVLGGYDVANLPEFNYGALARPIRAFFTKKTIQNVNVCLPVAQAFSERIRLICKDVRLEVVPTGHNTLDFSFQNHVRGKTIFTLSTTRNKQRYLIKGLDRFRELAQILPDYKFIVCGISDEAKNLFQPVPNNLEIREKVPFYELIKTFQESSYYAQFSRSEGFPSAICEAMLCGCIPLGTNVGDIQLLVEKIGFVVDEWNPNEMVKFIQQNHNNKGLRDMARNRILLNYKVEDRSQRILRLIDE